MTDALVHIGTHKTGTTAFQQWAQNHRGLLRRQGIELLDGAASSNYEVALLTMRWDRTMSMKLQVGEWCLPEWRAETTEHIREQVAAPGRLLVSAEALSLLRHEDEVEALAELLSPRDLRVAACLRDPAAWLASYRSTLTGLGEQPSRYRSSHAYVEPDTWLTRWDEMLSTWRRVLGDASVTAFSYEEAMAASGTTVPGVLDALGIPPLPFDGSEARLVNVSWPAR